MDKTVIIDGDIVAFRCAAANEKRSVKAVHKETLEEKTFKTATAFKEWAGDEKDDYELTPQRTPSDVSHALSSVKSMIKNITEKSKCENYHIVLSGDNNFRLDLPLPSRYKSNRDGVDRPVQLGECREYLIKKHGAEVSDGVEADDLLVEYAHNGYRNGEYVVLSSLDKDAHHGAFWLYDWTTMDEPELIEGFGELYLIEKESARKNASGEFIIDKSIKGKGRVWLYFQMLFGDAVDGFKPCELAKVKFGEIGAYNILKNCKTDKEALEVIVKQYKKWYPEPVTYKAWDGSKQTKDWMGIWQMYADCCFMRRWKDDRFVVKDVLDKMKVKY